MRNAFLLLFPLVVFANASETEEKNLNGGLSPVQASGTSFVDNQGNQLILQGVNLGNWFLLEPWMFGWFDIPDQHTIFSTLEERFGPETAEELLTLHYTNWLDEKDFERIANWGFNVVRLPVHYTIIEDLTNPSSLNKEGLGRIDHAIKLAAENGLYTILDLHGAPGGQSIHQPSGKVDQNDLWKNKAYQDRTVEIWRALAERYKDEASIAAYDVLNEPFGNGASQHHEPVLINLFDRIHDTIRKTGDETILLAPGTLRGIYFWPSSASMGWNQVGFTDHFYPGVFGGEATLEEHAKFMSRDLEYRQQLLEDWDAPFLVGEFNPIFESAGGGRLMAEYFRRYAELGWAATMWAYKTITPEGAVPDDNWPLLTNKNAVTPPDLRTASLEEIRAFFSYDWIDGYDSDESFLAYFAGEKDGSLGLAQFDTVRVPTGSTGVPAGWQLTEIGLGTREAFLVEEDDIWIFYGSGFDIFNADDSHAFIFQEVEGDWQLSVKLLSLESERRWAKVGLMLRETLDAGSPMVLWNIFPDDPPAMAYRFDKGSNARERKSSQSTGFPTWLRLTRERPLLTLELSTDGKNWEEVHSIRMSSIAENAFVGLALSNNDGHSYAKVTFTDPILQPLP